MPHVPKAQLLKLIKGTNSERADKEYRNRSCEVRSLPREITVVNTTACNISCFMCPRNARGSHHDSFMSREVFRKLSGEAFLTLLNVSLSASGEALVDPNIPLILDEARRFGVKVRLISNGLLLTESNLAQFDNILESVTISMDGATKETYEGIRRGSDFEAVLSNVKAFNRFRRRLSPDERPGLAFNYVLMRRNITEAPLFIDLAQRLEADEVTFNHVIAFNQEVARESLLFHRDMANRYLEETRRRAESLDIRARIPPPYPIEDTAGSPDTLHRGRPWEHCPFLWNMMFVESNGNVSPCCSDQPSRPVMGNIGSESVAGIWMGEAYRDMRRRLISDDPWECCLHCDVVSQITAPGDSRSFIKTGHNNS